MKKGTIEITQNDTLEMQLLKIKLISLESRISQLEEIVRGYENTNNK